GPARRRSPRGQAARPWLHRGDSRRGTGDRGSAAPGLHRTHPPALPGGAALRVVIIVNPAASGFTDTAVPEAVSLCEPLAGEVVVEYTTSPGEATGIAESISDSAAIVLSV